MIRQHGRQSPPKQIRLDMTSDESQSGNVSRSPANGHDARPGVPSACGGGESCGTNRTVFSPQSSSHQPVNSLASHPSQSSQRPPEPARHQRLSTAKPIAFSQAAAGSTMAGLALTLCQNWGCIAARISQLRSRQSPTAAQPRLSWPLHHSVPYSSGCSSSRPRQVVWSAATLEQAPAEASQAAADSGGEAGVSLSQQGVFEEVCSHPDNIVQWSFARMQLAFPRNLPCVSIVASLSCSRYAIGIDMGHLLTRLRNWSCGAPLCHVSGKYPV